MKQQGLLPSTQEKYEDIVKLAEGEGSGKSGDLIDWESEKLQQNGPLGSALPLRSAVKHYLISEKGYTEFELEALLPQAQGFAAEFRSPLSESQLTTYLRAVALIRKEPVHTILELLPVMGLRIGEMCSLQVNNIEARIDGKLVLTLKNYNVALNQAATQTLAAYYRNFDPKTCLFPTSRGTPIGPHAIRMYTRKIAADNEELGGLCPEVLRHTAAALWLGNGVSLDKVQKLLGHKSLQTTQRYAAAFSLLP